MSLRIFQPSERDAEDDQILLGLLKTLNILLIILMPPIYLTAICMTIVIYRALN